MAEPILDLYTLFGAMPPRGANPGADALRVAMAKHGVMGAVTLSTRALFHSASAGNRETQALCAESEGALLPAAVLDPRTPRAESLLSGARLISAFPTTQKWPVAYAPFENALAALAAREVKTPLFFEATHPGDATTLRTLLNGTGYRGAVVLAGLTGGAFAEAVALALSDERYVLCTDSLQGVGEIKLAVELVGANRVLFGSGGVARGSLAASLALARVAGLPEETLAQILGGNTKRLLAAGGVVA